jgi:hypothetical protein
MQQIREDLQPVNLAIGGRPPHIFTLPYWLACPPGDEHKLLPSLPAMAEHF